LAQGASPVKVVTRVPCGGAGGEEWRGTGALRLRHPRALAEAMEGFGVAEAAVLHGLPVMEIRAISNPVGPRDRAAWRIGDALSALSDAFGKFAPVLRSCTTHDD
ncbi:futalosine hydrolase, partial [Streptomyces venezuelae]